MLEKLPEVIGHALRHRRAGLDHTVFHQIDLRQGQGAMQLRSPAFADHMPLPVGCTADGDGVSPPLQWEGVPPTTDSLLLVVEDADAPTPLPLVHAIVVDLPANLGQLADGALNQNTEHPGPALHLGRHSLLQTGWLPPDPPPGHGQHRYLFQLFALVDDGQAKPFSATPGREEVVTALQQRAVASACLVGTYERADGSVPARQDAALATPLPLTPA